MHKLCTVLCLAPVALFAALPIVENVELQPLAAQAKRIVEASDYLGSPLTKEDRAAIEKAATAQDIQRALDKYCLFGVHINPESRVKVEPDGRVTVFTSQQPHGQGHETTFAQLVSDELGVPYDDITVEHSDTQSAPFGFGSYGSRSLAIGGTPANGSTWLTDRSASWRCARSMRRTSSA
jgi:CO/xanthine dehydrogenase Mo-binding subunit